MTTTIEVTTHTRQVKVTLIDKGQNGNDDVVNTVLIPPNDHQVVVIYTNRVAVFEETLEEVAS